jgi:hypothetical protein
MISLFVRIFCLRLLCVAHLTPVCALHQAQTAHNMALLLFSHSIAKTQIHLRVSGRLRLYFHEAFVNYNGGITL